MADGVDRVESALKTKLGQVQVQTQALQDVLAAVDTEIAKLARTQQHISSLQAHLQDKLVVNRERQQVAGRARLAPANTALPLAGHAAAAASNTTLAALIAWCHQDDPPVAPRPQSGDPAS